MTIRRQTVGVLATNCYIVADDNGTAAVIDPGADAAAIRKVLETNSLTLGAVLLTHAHFDHMGALDELVRSGGVPVYCHCEEESALADGTRNLSALFGVPVAPVTDAVLLDDGDVVTVGALRFTLLHTPGHTPGSCCYLVDGILFSGDTLFCESIGRTDFPGGSRTAIRASLARLLALTGVKRVLPGHDGETTLSHEQQYNPYIVR